MTATQKLSAALRGLLIVLGVVFGPIVVGRALIPIALSLAFSGLANLSFGVVIIWSYLLLPHLWIVRAPVSVPGLVTIALVEWALVGLVVGRLTAGRSFLRTLAVVGVSLVFVGAATHLTLRALGYHVIAEGP